MPDTDQIIESIKRNTCFSNAIKELGLGLNSFKISQFRKIALENNINLDHFDLKEKNRKYPWVTLTCPICKQGYKTQSGHPKAKTVCSKSCSNKMYRAGENHGNYNPDKKRYREVCFKVWPKACAVCEWDRVIHVHHIDYNHDNDDIKNLIPLCANHHELTKTIEYRNEIESLIKIAYNKFWHNRV